MKKILETINFKFGSSKNSEKLCLNPDALTIFVGPNNSGKSKALSEINQFCTTGIRSKDFVIVDKIVIPPFSTEIARAEIPKILKEKSGIATRGDEIIIGNFTTTIKTEKSLLVEAFTNRTPLHLEWFCSDFLRLKISLLDGKTRIALVDEQKAGDVLSQPINSFSTIFQNDVKRKTFQRIIKNTLGFYPVIDFSNLGKLRIKMSLEEPTEDIEKSLKSIATEYLKRAHGIEELSDGIKAFTGIILQLLAEDPLIIFIDEPEAFLHPNLANVLGKEIAKLASNEEKQVFIATHSSNFLMGALQAGVPVNIVRLTYLNGVASARVLANESLIKLMHNPLLRSAGVLSGLFYEAVIVTEADSDRAFYQEINERLLRFKPEWGIKNCLFLNAQNKQTVWQIIKPLRELGIPAAAIVDVDILKDGGKVFSDFLSGGCVPEATTQSLALFRASIYNKFKGIAKENEMKKGGGINLLSQNDKKSAEDFFENLAEYGLFALKYGELESWLKELQVPGHGPEWLTAIFEKMGDDIQSANYLRPSDGDVWKFIGEIKQWISNPNRKGIPD